MGFGDEMGSEYGSVVESWQEVLGWLREGFNGVLLAFGGEPSGRRPALFGLQGLLPWLVAQLRGDSGRMLALSAWELGAGGQQDLLQPSAQVLCLRTHLDTYAQACDSELRCAH